MPCASEGFDSFHIEIERKHLFLRDKVLLRDSTKVYASLSTHYVERFDFKKLMS